MNSVTYCSTSIGKKTVMAVTGLLLFLFVIAHLCGNLLIFAGSDAINSYGEHLRGLGPLLWVMRIGLLVVFVLHVFSAIRISVENREARPVPYRYGLKTRETSFAAKTMMISGLLLLLYVIYHLLHFTIHAVHSELTHGMDSMGRHDVYSMVVLSFQRPAISATYVAAMAILCAHLSHGIWSAFQTLGLTCEKTLKCLKKAAVAIAVLIFLGYSSIPVSVYFGILTLPKGGT